MGDQLHIFVSCTFMYVQNYFFLYPELQTFVQLGITKGKRCGYHRITRLHSDVIRVVNEECT